MPNKIIIDYKGKGLTKSQISKIVNILRKAKQNGKIPALSYEYNPKPMLFGKDPIYIRPKDAPLERTAVKIRQVIRHAFGTKYSVRLI